MGDFEKIQKKSKKIPFTQKNWKKSKKCVLKAEGVVKSIFSFFFTHLNVNLLIPKHFGIKNPKKTPFTPKFKIIQKMCFKGRRSCQINFFLFFYPPKCES